MARVEEERFTGKEIARVYIAARLPEARRVDETLTGHGVDYFVEIEPFKIFILGLFPSERSGVAFYVLAGQAQFSRRVLHDAGLKAGLLDEGEIS